MKKHRAEERFDFETHRDIVNLLAEQATSDKMTEANEFSSGIYEAFIHKFGRFESHREG